jgi:hypothetical protein
MDRNERLDLIDQLQHAADEGRAEIARREAERGADPIAYDNFLRAERQYEEKRAASDDVIYKEFHGNMQPAPEDNQAGWERWIAAHLKIERQAMLTIISEVVGDALQKLQGDIADIKTTQQSQREKADTLAEVKTKAAEVERQRVENTLDARDVKLNARLERLEGQLDALCKYLSVTGYNLPKGV